MLTILSVLFAIVSIVLILLILVQSDKGGGISGAVGGGLANANSVMGAQNTENVLTKGTVIFAALYIILTIVISLGVAKSESGNGRESGIKNSIEGTATGTPVE